MYLRSEIEQISGLLRSAEALGDCLVIKAYPYAKLPSRLGRAVIALSPSELQADGAEIGGERYFGEYTVNADIYVPQEWGSPAATDYAERTVNALLSLNPVRIRLGGIEAADALKCFKLRCAFSFCGEIRFEGGENDGE